MSKFGGTDYIFLWHESGSKASDKDTITRSGLFYAASKMIPKSRRFSTRDRETSNASAFDIRPFEFKDQYSPLTKSSFSPVNKNDKLFLFAHANASDFGPASAVNLAGTLKEHGLREVGLITFKACSVGVGTFLEDFVAALDRNGVRLGWAKAYKGSAATYFDVNDNPYESIRLPGKEMNDRLPQNAGDQRYKIVEGRSNPLAGQQFGRYR